MPTRRSLLLAAASLSTAACANFDAFDFDFGGLERATKEESRELDRTTLEIARSSGALHVSARTEPVARGDARCPSTTPTIDLTLFVPRDVTVDATTSAGDVSIEGPVGRVRVAAP